MAAEGLRSTRNDSTLVAPWPQKIDIKTDIFIPGKAQTFMTELRSALDTRQLLDPLLRNPPTMVAQLQPTMANTHECVRGL